ncbi:MAG TPA: hypothetical protein VE521_07630 [Nitrososphaera sp.]|nr:hypothetical protein [Nitrososphaera sp.]
MSNHSKKITDELQKKLEEIATKYAIYNKDEKEKKKNDGIHYWRGKPIIPLKEWIELSNFAEAFAKGVEYRNTKQALQFFPDDYDSAWLIFPLGVQPEYTAAANKWYLEYMQLLKFRKHPQFTNFDEKAFLEAKERLAEEERKKKERGEDGPWNSYGFE